LRLRDLYELLEAISRGPVRTLDIPSHSALEHLNYLIENEYVICEETEGGEKFCWLTGKGSKLYEILKLLESLD
jgi:predicted transcriptional regulator